MVKVESILEGLYYGNIRPDAQGEMEEITRYGTFTYALKFGILLMIEIFMGKGEITGGRGASDL